MARLLLDRSSLSGRAPTLTFETAPGERYTVDAAALQNAPGLLAPVAPAFSTTMYTLEMLAGAFILFGIVGTFLLAWWLVVPCLLGGLSMLAANRRTAARMAIDSAMSDNKDFTYLYRAGLIRKVAG